MKIIQIAVAFDAENGESLYALTDDGKLYYRTYEFSVSEIKNSNLIERKKHYRRFWKEVKEENVDEGFVPPPHKLDI